LAELELELELLPEVLELLEVELLSEELGSSLGCPVAERRLARLVASFLVRLAFCVAVRLVECVVVRLEDCRLERLLEGLAGLALRG
jgi:hypothetical protein